MGSTMQLQEEAVKPRRGQNSRTKRVLIEQAIATCPAESRYNRYAICEKLCELMEERYPGNNLEYHSQRMGMSTTRQMLREIDTYFYRLGNDLKSLQLIEMAEE